MSLISNRVVGWSCIATSVVLAAAAMVLALVPRPVDPSAYQPTASERFAPVPGPSASVYLARGRQSDLPAVPTAERMAEIQARVVTDVADLVPTSGTRVPTTSGIAYTLGLEAASLAMLWPTAEGGHAHSCVEAPPAGGTR